MNIDTSSMARPDTKMAQALAIFISEPATDGSKRKTCIERFQAELDMEESTAGTYYYLCESKVLEQQTIETEKAIASSKVKKFSSVKTKRGSDIASNVQVFLSRKAAEEFNSGMQGFTHVVPGIQKVGKPVAAA